MHQMDTRKRLMIPPRWLKCPRKGELVADRFLPFKTPLDSKYDDQIPLANRFSIEMLIGFTRQYFSLGMIIDLTNTSRFYDRKEIEDLGCKYVKLKCEGHQEAPTVEQTQIFSEIVNSFLENHPDKKIGIHCTHGFNRTGFLIISYMVEYLDWSVDSSVEEFSRCRPPGIYKHDYLQTLFHRYDDVNDCPPAPPLPDWCLDEDEEPDEDAGAGTSTDATNGPPAKKARLIRGPEGAPVLAKEPRFMEGVSGVFPVTDTERVREIQTRVATLCEWRKSSVFPGSQPVSMDRTNIGKLAITEYVVSWKADGTRYLMICLGEGLVYFLDRDNCVYHAPTIRFVSRKAPSIHLKDLLVDGEMIIDKFEGQSIPRFLIYDIIRFEGNEVGKCDFHRRCICIDKEIISPRVTLMKEGLLDKTREPFSIRQKHFWPINTVRKILDGDFAKQMSHEVDGLIFQPASREHAYHCGTFDWLLKWKPPELNSIDFQLKLVTERKEGCLPEVRGYLYVGGLDRPFSWMPATKRELQRYDNKIIECSYNMQKNHWQFMRQREDKSFPNHYSVAEAIVESIRAPVTKDYLYDFIEKHCQRSPKPTGLMGPPQLPPPSQFKAPPPPRPIKPA